METSHILVIVWAFVLLFVPGFLLGKIAGLPSRYALFSAAAVTYGLVAVSAAIFGQFTIAFTPLNFLLAFLVLSLLLAAMRLFRGGHHTSLTGMRSSLSEVRTRILRFPHIDSWVVIPAVAVVFAGVLSTGYMLRELFHMDRRFSNIPGGWDAHWHVSSLRFISETGIADPTQMGRLRFQDVDSELYYPSAWHALTSLVARLSGATYVETYNLFVISSLSVLFPLAAATLTWWILRDTPTKFAGMNRFFHTIASTRDSWRGASAAPGQRYETVVTPPARNQRSLAATGAAVAALMCCLLPSTPFSEIFTEAVPSATAIALSFLTAALLSITVEAGFRRPVGIIIAAIALLGVASVHPSGLLTAALITVVWWLTSVLVNPRQGRLKDFAILAAAGGMGVLLFLPQVMVLLSEVSDISSFSDPLRDATRADTLKYAATGRSVDVFPLGIEPLVILVMIGGLVTALVLRKLWPIVVWLLFVLLAANALMSFPDPVGSLLSAVGSTYYNTPRRIAVVVTVFCIAACGLIAAYLTHVVFSWLSSLFDQQRDKNSSLRLGVIVACLCVIMPTFERTPMLAAYAIGYQRMNRMHDGRDFRAWDWLAAQPKAYSGMIWTLSEEGNGWMYPYNGLPTLFRHYLQDARDTGVRKALLAQHISQAGSNSEIDEAIRHLGITYLVISPPNYWHFQKPNPVMFELDSSPGLVNVYRDQQVKIYAVRAAFSEQELAAIRSSAEYSLQES